MNLDLGFQKSLTMARCARAMATARASDEKPANPSLCGDGGAPGFDVAKLLCAREADVKRERGAAEFRGEQRFK